MDVSFVLYSDDECYEEHGFVLVKIAKDQRRRVYLVDGSTGVGSAEEYMLQCGMYRQTTEK